MARAGTLTRAIERRSWEAASLCLLVAVAEAANRLPPQALEEMLQLLAGETAARPRRPAGHPRRKGR